MKAANIREVEQYERQISDTRQKLEDAYSNLTVDSYKEAADWLLSQEGYSSSEATMLRKLAKQADAA